MPETYILTLVSSQTPLSAAILGGIEVILMEQDNIKEIKPRTWLSPERAIDIKLSHKPHPKTRKAVKALLEAVQIDHFITPDNENRRKKLLMADMDSTIVTGETLDDVAQELRLRPVISAITQRAMRGELDFKSSLRERVALLAGKPASALQKIRESMSLNKGAQTLVHTMKRHGAVCVLVSGGFTYFTSSVAQRCGFHHHHGNDMIIKNEEITGFLSDPILDQNAKKDFMREYMSHKNLKPEHVLAIGDGANDRPMIEEAGLGIGYHPHPVLEEATENIIRYGDLTAALFAQGYHEKELRYARPQPLPTIEEESV